MPCTWFAGVSWQQALDALSVAYRNPALPRWSPCPLCHRTALWIGPDPRRAAAWLHCAACQFAGTPLELCAAVWKCDLETAAARFRQSDDSFGDGYPDWTEAAAFRARQQQLQPSAEAERSAYYIPAAQQPLAHALGLPGPLALEAWQTQLRPLYQLAGAPLTSQLHRARALRRADYFAVPFEDVPGRPCAVATASTPTSDTTPVYAQYELRWPDLRPVTGGGVTWLGLLAAQRCGALVLVQDAWTALRFQLQHKRTHGDLLTLAAWTPGANLPATLALVTDDPVLWAEDWTSDLLALAAGTHARVLLAPPSLPGHMTPARRLEQVLRQARPWTEVLAETLKSWTETRAEVLLAPLRARGPELLPHMAQQLPPAVRARFLRLAEPGSAGLSVLVNGYRVWEDATGWRTVRQGVPCPIANASVRITKFVAAAAAQPLEGTLHFDAEHESIPFRCARRDFQRQPFAFLAALAAQRGRVLTYDRRFERDVLQIATAFAAPAWGPETPELGWDAAARLLRLPGWTLAAGGDLQPAPGTGSPWARPAPLDPAQRAALKTMPAAALELLAHWNQWVLGPSLGVAALPLAVEGAAAADALAWAAALGAATHTVRKATLPELNTAWPQVLVPGTGNAELRPAAPVLIPLPEWLCLRAFVQGGHGWLRAPTPLPRELRTLLPALLGAYWGALAEQHFQPKAKSLLDDFRHWLGRQGRSGLTFRTGAPEERLAAFGQLLGKVAATGLAAVARHGYDPEERQRRAVFVVLEHPPGDLVAVRKPALNAVLRKQKVPPLDNLAVTELLEQCAVFRGDLTLQEEPCWTLDAAWWRSALRSRSSVRELRALG